MTQLLNSAFEKASLLNEIEQNIFARFILDEISSENNLWVAKLNVDENPVKTAEFSVTSIPTMVLFEGGKPVKTIIGAKEYMPNYSVNQIENLANEVASKIIKIVFELPV